MVYVNGSRDKGGCSELIMALTRPICKLKKVDPKPRNVVISDVERSRLVRELNEKRPVEGVQSQQIPVVDYKLVEAKFDQIASGEHAMLSEDSKVMFVHPFCSSCFHTQAATVNLRLSRNRVTYWQIEVDRNVTLGTSVMFGIVAAGATQSLTTEGYLHMLGNDANSWALSNKGSVHHGGESRPFCAPFDDGESVRIGCLFDGFTRQLSFYVNGIYMGVAFDNIPLDVDYKPVVSSTVVRSLFRIEIACESFPTLKQLSKNAIIAAADANRPLLNGQTLPKSIVNFILNK